MAQLKDTIVSGNLRVTDTTLTDTLQVTTIKAPTSSGTYGPGTSGQVLKSNGTSVYWGSDSNSVTGVKGNAESSYRTGNVNLTPANIGALASTTKYAASSSVGGPALSVSTAGGDVVLGTSGSSSDDSGDIYWKYGNGQEKARLYLSNTYTAKEGPLYRIFKSDGTGLYSGRLPLADGTSASGTWGINITGNSANVTDTVAIAHGGTGATNRLAALRALTEQDVGTSAQYFLTITNSWGQGGYTSVANAKTVLGLKSAAYTESSEYAPSSHTHGNITNGGALQTTDITIASGDKLVVTDSSDSNKVARASISFDGSTATKCLTQKGTWETFASSNTDIKVNVTLAATTKAYLLGTSTTPTATAQAVTSVADTGVYLGTTAGSLYATSFYENGTSLASKYAAIGHKHTTTIAADSGTNQLTLSASTKYKLTAGETNFIFTTPPNTTYSAGTGLSLSGTTFNHSNSVTAVANYNKPYVKYDAQGHITGSSYWTATAAGTSDESGWIKVATMVHTDTHDDTPIMLLVSQRGNTITYKLHIVWKNTSNTDPDINKFRLSSDIDINADAYIKKSTTSTWELYIKKLDNWDAIAMHLYVGKYFPDHMTWTWQDVQTAESAITGGIEAEKIVPYNYYQSRTANTVLVAPNGSDGKASFRKLVAADLTGINYAGSSSAGGPATYVELPRVTADAKSFPGANKVEFKEYSNTSTNTPSNAWYHILRAQGDDTRYGTQLALGMTTNGVYYRNYNNQTWIDWQPLGRFIATPTSGQVVITDGTIGGMKSSGSTIVATPSGKVNTNWGTTSDRTTIVTKGWMSYWDGSYDGSASNLTYCNKGAFGTIVTKNTGDYVPMSGSMGVTGNIEITKASGDVGFYAKRSDTGVEVWMGVGSGGTNHGIYSNKLGKWMMYGDATDVHLNGNAATATKLETPRTINGVSFDGSANITIPRSIKHIHTANGTDGSGGWVKIARITVTEAYADQPMTFTIAQRRIMQYRIHLLFTNSGSVANTAISEFIITRDNSWTDTNNDPRAYIIKPSDGIFDLYIRKTVSWDRIFVVDFTKADDGGGINYSITWENVHVADSAITGGTEAVKKLYLPTSGGTVNGAITASGTGTFRTDDLGTQLIVERTDGANMAGITFKNTSGVLGYIAANTVDGDLYHYGATDTSTMKYAILDTKNCSNYTFKVTRGSSKSTATSGYWAAMCNSTQTGSPVLPTSGKWWHVISMDWTNNDVKNWISQLAIATQEGSGVWWRRNDTGGTSIDSYSWHRLAEGNSSGAATHVETSVATTDGARPVFYAYLGDNTRVVYNTNFTYNPSGNVLTATTFAGNTFKAGKASTTDGEMLFYNSGGSGVTTLKASAKSTSGTYLLPERGNLQYTLSCGHEDLSAATGSLSAANVVVPSYTKFIKIVFKSDSSTTLYSMVEIPYFGNGDYSALVQVGTYGDGQQGGSPRIVMKAVIINITDGTQTGKKSFTVTASPTTKINGSNISNYTRNITIHKIYATD